MAKKMVIKLHKNRPNLMADFTSWIAKRHATPSYGCYDEYYDDYGCFGLGWENNWGFPQDEDDDEWNWTNQRKDILAWQEALDGDDTAQYENYWNRKAEESRKKNNKRGKRGGKKREAFIDNTLEDDVPHLTDEEINGILDESKTIYFYRDIYQENDVQQFTNLRQFFNFLEEEGIDISDEEGGKFIRSQIRHCCINPLKRETLHVNEIISDHSYGALAYEVSEDATIFQELQ